MKRFLLVILCLISFRSMASHIVGGEFEIIHISGNSYRINLIYYFDVLNNGFGGQPPELQEPFITAAIFRKANDGFLDYVTLNFVSRTSVSYTQPECTSGHIVTEKVLYTATYTLSPNVFNEPEGYYIVWERCCRNYTITNVVSKEPPLNNPSYPDAAGQTFYLEFPPVVKDGQPFINSTPRLFPPLNDYGCPYRPYFADFAGVDDDGDSLVYSLVTPLSTHTTSAVPPLLPAPYPTVKWQPGYGLDNIMNGDPDLTISADGLLTVTPTEVGLFVFAVKCEEFRDGVKIGEVRRDFQMLVVDGCEPAEPPKIVGKKIADATYTYETDMTLTFPQNLPDEERCIQVRVSDPDALATAHQFTEKIKLRAVPLNFKGNMSHILPDVSTATLVNGSTIEFDICFDRCPPIDGPFKVAIIAQDDECSLPLMDTLKLTVHIEQPENEKARFLSPDVVEIINEGEHRTWPIYGIDPNGDSLWITVLTPGFTLEDFGMSVSDPSVNTPGNYHTELVWDPKCDIYDFSQQTEFLVTILLDDKDYCGMADPDTLTFDLGVILPVNAPPEITSNLSPDEITHGITRQVFENITFTINGTDADGDELHLVCIGNDFSLDDYGMQFPGAIDYGSVSSVYNWTIPCTSGELRREYQLHFVVMDSVNYCRIPQADILTINVYVEPPDNLAPDLTVINTNPELTFDNHEQSLEIGQQISLGLTATDANADSVRIELFEATGNVTPTGYEFSPATAKGLVETTFAWNPDCSIFHDGVYQNKYVFRFLAYDDRCHHIKADTVDVTFYISDKPSSFSHFLPPNRITPNDDGVNEYFAMVKEVGTDLVDILPPDNCQGQFVSITIYNRWGRKVFDSDSRDFRWYPDKGTTGIYYYTLRYSNREYKGSVALRSD